MKNIQQDFALGQNEVPIYITDCDRLKQKTQWQPEIKPEKTFEDIYKLNS